MRTRTTIASASCLASALALVSCADDETTTLPPPPPPIFLDNGAGYQQLRDCRRSADHDLSYIRVLADAQAIPPYVNRDVPFPAGAVILKIEYADPPCTDLVGYTAMRRDVGIDPAGGDWHWQRANRAGTVTEDGIIERCKGCHTSCGVPPDGHDGTCAVP